MGWSAPYTKVLKAHKGRWVRARGKDAELEVATFIAGEIETFHGANSLEHDLPGSLVKVRSFFLLISAVTTPFWYYRKFLHGTATT